ncbi:hypothetical protein [Gandjariella thermophila]|uniref:Secreted protein n=1 Tax=Gandjariella thermophila TaxID=1931992 RepID=A0A4D4J0D2_9PSEU|nr:hypothetical protein [Gandjariella thermophila]GDY29911.1 hypothetical protein GTS_15440 [Gandjariella thermophila]
MALVARVATALPFAGAVAAAAALTGAAVFTVADAGCGNPGRYVRHDGVVELVGGCVDTNRLPAQGRPAQAMGNAVQQHDNGMAQRRP